MAKRIIFLIRGKLGDSLVAYSVFKKYVDNHPDENISLLIRRNYAELLRNEKGFRIIPYRNRLQATSALLASRLFGKNYDVFAVLWGFGEIVPLLARVSNAKRKIYLDSRYSTVLTEYPSDDNNARQIDPPWQVARLLDPTIDEPDILLVKSLVEKRKQIRTTIGITPLSDEPRRNMDTATLEKLLTHLHKKHPETSLHVFINPGEEHIVPKQVPASTEIKVFRTLPQLVNFYSTLSMWYGTDTGLYHLAAAMDIPCQLFFGPTQPGKIILSQQRSAGIRLEALGNTHCDEKTCQRPVCLHLVVSNYCDERQTVDIKGVPTACPLRQLDSRGMLVNKLHGNTHNKTR